ncbi:MAG: hypothetical protein KC645_08855, partial [Gemmatimonadetes bacterium]|nr:hypothetical protein [Gemmatimonadota bacterium]
MMTRASRILVLVAALALGLVFALPVWTIDLEAPQYPEGLGMVIRVNTIEGKKPNDLGNINNLNHYIGMRRIEPESIPELVWMPWLVGALLAGGVAVAALGRRKALYVWTAGYLLIAVVGLADFYRWEHDYGHNLDEEHAIIKIPGMSYQPPLLGSRQILNFTAHSWPGAGGWILVMVGVTAVAVATSELRTGRGPRVRRPRARGAALPAAAALSVLAVGMGACGAPGPRPLAVGTDVCERCHMTVADDGGGA